MHLHDAVSQAEIAVGGIRIVAQTPYTFLLCSFAPTVATRELRILLRPDYKTLDQVYDDRECFADFVQSMTNAINAYIKSGVRSLNYAILQDNSPYFRLNVLIAASQNPGAMERILHTPVIEELPEVSAQVLRDNIQSNKK